MKRLFSFFAMLLFITSCQKHIETATELKTSTVKRSVATSTTDVTNTFDDLLNYPVNIIVKENNLGKTYLTDVSSTARTEGSYGVFESKSADNKQTFYLKKDTDGNIQIYTQKQPSGFWCWGVETLRGSTQPVLGISPIESLSESPYRNPSLFAWRILKGETQHQNAYLLKNVGDNRFLGSALNSKKPYFDQYTNTGLQEFEIRPVDDFELITIEYINDASATINQQPDFVTQWFYSNNTSIQQSMSTAFSQRASNTSTFSQTTGGSITLGASLSFKVKIPVAESNLTINTSTSVNHSATYGKSEVMEDAQTYNFPINVAPRTSVTATATVSRYLINLKYKATMRGRNTGKLIQVSGIWEGISCTDVKVALVERSLETGQIMRTKTLDKVPASLFKF